MEDKDQKLKALLGNLFKENSRLSNKYNTFNIDQIWRETFGHVISNYTTKVNFFKGVLTVYISSSPLKQELTLTKQNVIDKLNANLKYKKVKELVVR